MAYDEHLADRIRAVLADREEVSERKMFGGIAFLVSGHMCVGIVGSDLMVRVGKDAFDKALSAPHARPMDFTGKPSTGMVYVAPAGVKMLANLRKWIDKALSFTSTLPPRVVAPARRTRRSKSR
jgi:TfoX/Sxy family transcriptional regulator of competence genes